MNRYNTLSSKLFIRIAPTIVITIILIGGFAFHSANKEINTVYDAQLISDANVLWTLTYDEFKNTDNNSPKKVDDIDLVLDDKSALNASADEYADSRMFRVWKENNLMLYSDTALPADIPKQLDGFSTIHYKGEAWRIYTLPVPGKPISIEVGEKIDLRDTLIANILLNLAVPLLLLVPAVGILIWVSINSGLGTIRYLVRQIQSRSPGDLSPVDTKTLPQDLYPLGNALNQLFTKLEHSFAAEKRFTDHAAHQLRTPQATIRLQLQMLAKATNAEEKKALLDALILSNERATKLVNMLLTSARINHQPIALQPIILYPVIAAVIAEFGLLAQQKYIEMSLEGDEYICVLADEILLKLMMSNLIDNAIKYTPSHGKVNVRIAPHSPSCTISVTDTGCGIPETERKLVFERFYRISTPEPEGTGLGLAIVADIVERFSGSIALKTPESGIGLQVEITLPVV